MKGHQIPFKKNIILGTSIVLSSFVLGLMIVWAVKTLKSFDDTVSVRGLCEREVSADRVTYRIHYNEQDNDLASLRTKIDSNNDIVVAYLKKAGISAESITYLPANIEDRYSYSYNSNAIFRYSASQWFTIMTTDMDVVRRLQKSLESDLLKKNIVVSSNASYEYTGLNSIKPEMIAESLANARDAAEEFAKNSHSKIGKMKTASQGYFSIDDVDETSPQIKKVRVVTTVEYYLK